VAKIVGELGVEITAESDGLAEEIRAKVEAAVREAATSQIALSVNREQLAREIREGIAAAQAETGNIKVGVELDKTSVATLKASVEAATKAIGETSEIKPKVDPKTAQADFEKFANNLKSKLSDLQGGFNSFASGFFSSVFQAAKWSTIVVGAAQAAQSVVTLSGALGVLPGAIFSAVGAIAALKIGTENFGQTLKDIGTPKFAEDLQKLAPAARDTATAIAGLKPAFTALQLDVQQTLFDGLGSRIRSLAAADLPILRTGLAGFADSLNQTAKGVFDFLSGANVRADLPQLFNSAQASVFNLGQALPAVLDILRNLTVVGSQAFANLTGGAQAATERVAAFVQRARDSGQLAAFIDAGIAAFRQLASIIGNVIDIVAKLVTSLGGGGILGLLDNLTSTLRNFLNSAAGSQALTALGAAMQQIAASAGQVFLQLLTSLGQVLADHAPDIAAFAKALGDNLVQAIQVLQPILSGLLDAIGAHPQLFANIAIGAVALAGALNVLVPIVTVVAALISAGTVGLVAAIVAAVVAAVVLIITNFDTIKAFIGSVLDSIGQFFVFLGTTIANAFGSAVDFVVGIWNNVVSFFVGIGTAIGTAVSNAVQAVGQFFADGFNAVVGFVGGVITSIVNFFVALPGQVAAFIAGIPQAFVDMTNQIAFAVGFGIGVVLRFFVDLPGNVINAINSLITLSGEWALNVWNTITTFFVNGVNAVVAFVTSLPGLVINAVTNLIVMSGQWALSVWDSVRNFFVNGVNSVVSFVTSLPGQVINAIVNLQIQIGLWALGVWNNARNAFVNGVNAVVSFVTGLPGMVVNAIGNLGSRLYQVGVDALNGLLNGLKSIAQSILNWVSGLVSNILHGFTSGFDSHSPSRETYAIGQDVAQGLANALRDSQQLVGDAAGELAQAGLDGLSPILNPTVNTAAVANGISAAANGLTTNPAAGVNYTVQQTNVMQQGTDVNQFADAVLKNGAAALANGASLLGVSQLGVQAGVNPNFLAVSGV
jgi:phage-related protein